MSRMHRVVISVVLVVALFFAVCTVRPQPVYADDTETILIVLGGVIGGLMVLALVFTFFVRDNPAWMPAAPSAADTAFRQNPWDRPGPRLKFGLSCARDSGVPLLCW
jgi:hypothetical protein